MPEQDKIDLRMSALVGKAESECNSSESHRAQNCTEYLSTNLITAEEWETLFPEARFYLIEARQIINPETNMDGSVQSNFIIAKQGQYEYKDEDFGKLLADNQIVITEENIELILRAFARFTAANHYNADPTAVQSLLIIPGATNIAMVRPFWQAVPGYEPRRDSPDEDLVDPHDRGPAFWFEQMNEPRGDGSGAIHVAIWVPYEQSEARIKAAGWCATSSRPHGGL